MKSGGFLHERATYARTPGRPQACVQKHSARHGHCFREALRAHTHLVVRQQAFALDAPRDPSLAILVPDHASWRATVDAGCGVTSRTEGRPRSVPSLVQPRRQSPRRPARGRQGSQPVCHASSASHTDSPRSERVTRSFAFILWNQCTWRAKTDRGKCRGKQERIDNAYTIKMSRFSEYGLFHVISSTKSVHSCRKLFTIANCTSTASTAHIVRCAAKRLVFRHLRDVEVPISPDCRKVPQLFRDSRRQSQRVTNDYAYLA